MNNELTISLNAPYTLNFMIYIQNVYLNQRGTEEYLKFPHFHVAISFHPDFEIQFKALWLELKEQIAEPRFNEMELFYERKNVFYECLFQEEAQNLEAYHTLHLSFETWWASLAGRFSVERATDDSLHSVYHELSNLLAEANIKPLKPLQLHVIYDKCTYIKQQEYGYYAIYSIEDFLRQNKKLAQMAKKCFA